MVRDDTIPKGTSAGDRRGGIDRFDSLLVRQPIREGRTDAVLDLLAEWARGNADGDAGTLLPDAGVHLVTLFLDRGGFRSDDALADALVWYVEVADADVPPWTFPASAVRSSPVFGAGLDEHLAGGATVHAPGYGGQRHVVHVTNPHRNGRYDAAVGRPLVAPVAGGELSIPVVLVSLALRPGWRTMLVARALDVVNFLKRFDTVDEWTSGRTDVVEEEAMYTESLLFDPSGSGPVVHYYMETEDMSRLYEAFEDSDAWETRLSEWLFGQLLVSPDEFLTPPLSSDCEVLVHAVDPDRP